MGRRFLLLLLFFILSVPGGYSQRTDIDDRLLAILRQYGQAEVTIPYSDRKTIDFITRNVSILSVRDNIIHISLSPVTAEWFIQQKFDYHISERTESKGLTSAQTLRQAAQWDKYPTYSQYDSIMKSFQALYPDLCRLETIGTSIYGKLIMALKISDNAANDEDEPEVLYSSSIHGDETGGFILMLRLADYLLKNYNTSNRVKNLVDNLEIWINPLANPDGTYRTGNQIVNPVRYNANGIDLNRNFPDPVTPGTVQQKENIDMMKFLQKHRFVISANFHAGTEVVNYPWDRWLSKYHADNTWFNDISRAYADTAHIYGGAAYMNELDNGVTRGAEWYVIYGGRQDYVTYELQGREVTIELDDITTTPAAQLSLLWQNNWHSLLGYLENALFGIHGRVRDKVTLEPVAAKIFIKGHDKDSSHVYSDSTTGNFIRMLAPGSWDLTFSAQGYTDTTISNIIVYNRQKTEMEVSMVPLINSIDTINPDQPLLYPNPVKTILNAIIPDKLAGIVNIRIFSQTGMLLNEYNSEAYAGIPLIIKTDFLPGGVYSVLFRNISTNLSGSGRFVVIK